MFSGTARKLLIAVIILVASGMQDGFDEHNIFEQDVGLVVGHDYFEQIESPSYPFKQGG